MHHPYVNMKDESFLRCARISGDRRMTIGLPQCNRWKQFIFNVVVLSRPFFDVFVKYNYIISFFFFFILFFVYSIFLKLPAMLTDMALLFILQIVLYF